MGITQIKEWYNRFKDSRTSVESDIRSGRPSTSRNDERIEQVRTLVMQDRRVTVRELAEEVGISTGSVHSILTDHLALWRVSAKFAEASWQRTSSFFATDSKFLGQTQHSCGSTSSLLSRHGSLRLMPVPPPENAAERDYIWVTRRHYTENVGHAVLHSQRGIPEMLRTMAEPLGEVCSVTRRLLRKWLWLQTSRRVNIFFPAKGRILFEQPTYS